MPSSLLECPSKITQIHEWIRLWGNSTSEVILDTNCLFFQTPGIDGFIGYRLELETAVVFGDPVCAPKNTIALAEAFHEFCRKSGTKIIYMLASEPFALWALSDSCKVMIEVCEELAFNPQEDPTIGHKAHRLRNKVNHTHTLGLEVVEYLDHDPKMEAAIQHAGNLWLEDRKGPQIHLGPLHLFADRTDKRWFYVKDSNNTIVSVALMRKLDAYHGWFLKFLVTIPTAPRGSSELLVLSIIETLRKENCNYLSIGMVPAPQLGIIHGLGRFYKALARNLFSVAKWIFRLEHRKMYWEQFHPTSKRFFIVFSEPSIGIGVLRAILKALNAKA